MMKLFKKEQEKTNNHEISVFFNQFPAIMSNIEGDDSINLGLEMGKITVKTAFIDDSSKNKGINYVIKFSSKYLSGTKEIVICNGKCDKRYVLRKNKIFIPKDIRNNMHRNESKNLEFNQEPKELKLLEGFLDEWFSFYYFMKESKMDDYLASFTLENFATNFFENYVEIWNEIHREGVQDKEYVKLTLNNEPKFHSALEDVAWERNVDEKAFDDFYEYFNYKHNLKQND